MEIEGIRAHPRLEVIAGIDLTPSLYAAPSSDLRSRATYARVSRAVRQEALTRAAATPPLRPSRSELYVVREGDTLSEIVHARLSAMGRPVSAAELYEHVAEVARANGMANADVISPGQQIDLGALEGIGGSSRRAKRGAEPIPIETPRARTLFGPALDGVVSGETRISSGFGLRHDPFDGSLREHRGIDIAAERGSPIHSIAEGTVVFAGWHGGHGKTVIVKHPDGSESVYAHADQLLVDAGDRVDAQDKLGLVGSTGRSTGPHLHLELRQNGVAVDPLGALAEQAGEIAMDYSM